MSCTPFRSSDASDALAQLFKRRHGIRPPLLVDNVTDARVVVRLAE